MRGASYGGLRVAILTEDLLNKEQLKHIAEILKEAAIGQFIFFGGKAALMKPELTDFDWLVILCSAMIYLVIHAIIFLVLSFTEE